MTGVGTPISRKTAAPNSRHFLKTSESGFWYLLLDGEVLRGPFIIDAHDREIIAWRAIANAGISGSDVCDIMLESVENRFGDIRAATPIEILSDSGSAYAPGRREPSPGSWA